MMAKKKEKKAAAPASSGTTAAVQAVVEHARRFVECAAIVRAAGEAVLPTFMPQSGRTLPEVLLRRVGEGPRPATVDAVVDAELAIEGLARQFEERARALLVLPVSLGEQEPPPATEGLSFDTVVRTTDIEFDLGIAKKVAGGVDPSSTR